MSKKILVVDDEKLIRDLLRGYLIKLGYEIKEAADGEQAIRELGREDVALLICDIEMPNKDGRQVIKEARSNPKTKDIPVIILTSKGEEDDIVKGYELGTNFYITNPLIRAQLLYGIELMLKEDFKSPPVAGKK
jgi:DNA-binding response OmpR family regulator